MERDLTDQERKEIELSRGEFVTELLEDGAVSQKDPGAKQERLHLTDEQMHHMAAVNASESDLRAAAASVAEDLPAESDPEKFRQVLAEEGLGPKNELETEEAITQLYDQVKSMYFDLTSAIDIIPDETKSGPEVQLVKKEVELEWKVLGEETAKQNIQQAKLGPQALKPLKQQYVGKLEHVVAIMTELKKQLAAELEKHQ